MYIIPSEALKPHMGGRLQLNCADTSRPCHTRNSGQPFNPSVRLPFQALQNMFIIYFSFQLADTLPYRQQALPKNPNCVFIDRLLESSQGAKCLGVSIHKPIILSCVQDWSSPSGIDLFFTYGTVVYIYMYIYIYNIYIQCIYMYIYIHIILLHMHGCLYII